MKNYQIKLIIVGFFSLFSLAAFAGNYSFLVDSPVSYFTNQDWDIYKSAEQKAIHSADGVKVTWKNPASGAWGYFIPSQTRKESGTVCRTMRVVSNAKARSGEAAYKVCKYSNGWKAV